MNEHNENSVAKIIVDVAFQIHKRIGPGLLESAYQTIMINELKRRGLRVKSEVLMPVIYDETIIENGYRADMIVEDLVIIELKSVEKIAYVHQKQLLTYLKLSNYKLGLLINFGAPLIKYGIKRVVNGLEDNREQIQKQ
ncbi:MAG TPA: GxxExxY protein [Anaerolineaceae bacterium]|nr:GxxExxY protein [Anaerolineaceae bacterium]